MRKSAMMCAVWLGWVWASTVQAQNWTNWRGPNYNGSTVARDLPESVDPKAPLWVTPMPGHSNGTPIVFEDKVFVTAMVKSTGKLTALCVSRKDGKVLWQKDVVDALSNNRMNDYATPSPVTDGKMVVFLYGQGTIAAFDMDGKELWKRDLQKDHGTWNVLWIYGSSPLLYKGKLYVQVLHRNVAARGLDGAKAGDKLAESYLLALDPKTGGDLWKQVRPSDAVVESLESYATPIPWEKPSRTELLIVGGDCVSGHDPETGKEYWRGGGWNPQKITHWRLVPSAVTFEQSLAVICTPKGGPIIAWKEGAKGDVTGSGIAWKSNGFTSDVCVPLIYKGNMYVLDGDKKQMLCIDPATGNRKWAGTLDSRSVFRASLTGADNRIYAMNESGDLYICSTDEFKVLSKASLSDGGTRGSIAAVDGMILVRTGEKLWAFGKK